jgi:catechol 2,3-dioxygenase-like lactoylglutathione lyase family enzyme
LDKALAFYRDVLGFDVVMEGGWKTGSAEADRIIGLGDTAAKFTMLSKGDSRIELFEYSSPAPKQADPTRRVCDHGYTHICLEVEDIDSEYERLQAGGMTFHAPPPEAFGIMRAIYGRDPDGNVIELLEIVGT